MSEPREVRACAVCGRVLDYSTDNGWHHSLLDREHGEDHPAVPVSLEEIQAIGRCDFCSLDFPTMTVPARSFQVLPGRMSHGDWAACDTCADLIQKNQWTRMIERAMGNVDNRSIPQPMLKASLSVLYKNLRKNITGVPYKARRS